MDVSLAADGTELGCVTRRFGVRRVELDRSPHPVAGEHFTIRVNGRPVFARGANWVPPDMIPSSVTPDQHPWGVSLGPAGPDFRVYRTYNARFASEGGVLGATSPATVRQFLPESERVLRSFAWDHHDNAVNFWREEEGVTYRAVDLWLGRDYRGMDLDEYLYASALLQAEGLTEYVNNFRRRMFSSSGAVFWMFNDSWPTTHGWTIVDYYGRRKLAYHPVRRAFEPVTVVVVDEGPEVVVYGVNDTPYEWQGTLRSGLFGIAGGLPRDDRQPVVLPAARSTPVARISRAEWEGLGLASHGAFAVLEGASGPVASHRLFVTRFKHLALADPAIEVTRRGDHAVFRSEASAWGVTLDLDGEVEVPDDCFDLLPGIERTLPWPADRPLPKVQRIGNALATAIQ